MTAKRNPNGSAGMLRMQPDAGTQIQATKNQGYQLPLALWQDLIDETARRKKLGLPRATQNSIAIAAITEWLEQNKGAES